MNKKKAIITLKPTHITHAIRLKLSPNNNIKINNHDKL